MYMDAECLITVCFVVGTWVTFGSQITDKVGRRKCTFNITLSWSKTALKKHLRKF